MSDTTDYRFLPLRSVPLGEGCEARYDRWLAALEEELADPGTDRYDFCRRVLEEIYFPGGLETAHPILRDQLDPATSRWSPSTTSTPTSTGTIA